MKKPSVILTELIGAPPVSDGLIVGLSDEETSLLFSRGRTLTLRRGEHVFRQGEPHTGIFIINSGQVRVYYGAPNGREITLAHWTPPNFIGGPELFGNGEYDWSGVALEKTELVHIPGPELRKLALSTPVLAVNLLDGLIGKARSYSLVMQMLGTRSVLERLAYLLLTLSQKDGSRRRIDRRLSHNDIATVVGATRQWVSHAMDRFRTQGLIETDNKGHIIILKSRNLEEIAQT